MSRIEDDATLRRAFSSLAATPEAAEHAACPEPERIYDAVRGKLPPAELRAMVAHLAECPACAEAWRLAAAFEEEAGAAVGAAPAVARRPFPRLVAVAAAAVLALVAAGMWWTSVRAPEAPVYRAAGDAEIVSLLPEGEPLDRDAPVLRWQVAPPGAPEGTVYAVLVSTESLEVVAEATELEEARFEIPAEALESLPAGAELLWRIEATTPEGHRFTSPTFLTSIE